MSRARHGMKSKPKAYNAVGSNVEKEAMEKKFGGKVAKEVDKPEGKKAKHRMDKRPRKAGGGRVSPWSSAASPKQNTEA
jgi:hypothetical protein